jgi:hypothetical protein
MAILPIVDLPNGAGYPVVPLRNTGRAYARRPPVDKAIGRRRIAEISAR